MKKSQRLEILNSLDLLNAAQVELHDQTNKQMITNLCADCQDFAMNIGNCIESIVGEGTQTVNLLEDYCELLFKYSNNEVDINLLDKQLLQIQRSAKTEFKCDRIEMAFLAYSASMSDSIMSIYLAAKDDPDCEAYWIPIPYFSKKSDGSADVIHFEGAEHYPQIQCIDYRKYNIEERHPDVIFTYNPYDDKNYVTSVLPDFYCKRLRNLTDCLVYVPYYVVDGELSDTFACVPGVLYAHKVILPDEKMKKFFTETLKNYIGNTILNFNDKFVVLGSPKIDAVINTHKEDCKIPDKWRDLIGDKKVILYNTSLSSIMSHRGVYLRKLRSVLEAFRKRDDVVLWWRPHPLSECTFLSMLPEYSDEYVTILNRYKDEGWGIYDDSTDLHRAIAFSDAYYGDVSSVMKLYKVAGKSIKIQDINKLTLIFEDICDYGGYFWGSAVNCNGLFRIDKDTLNAQLVTVFSSKDKGWRRYNDIVPVDDKLFFIPCAANDFAVYDLNSGILTEIEIKRPCNIENYDDKKPKFLKAVAYKDDVYFFGYAYPGIVKINVQTLEIEYHEECFPNNTGRNHIRSIYFNGKEVIMIHMSSQQLLSLNLDSLEIKVLKEFKFTGEQQCGELSLSGDYYYIPVAYGNVILKIDINSFETSTLCIPEKLIGKIQSYVSAEYCGSIWFLPVVSGDIPIKIETANNKILKASEFETKSQILSNSVLDEKVRYLNLKKYGNALYTFEMYQNQFIEYDCELGTMRKEKITLNSEEAEKLANDEIDILIQKETNTLNNAKPVATVGIDIYNYCKSQVMKK